MKKLYFSTKVKSSKVTNGKCYKFNDLSQFSLSKRKINHEKSRHGPVQIMVRDNYKNLFILH